MNILTIKELSTLIRIKEKTLYQWANLGVIPCIKLQSALRFDLDDIQTWINKCKKEAQSSYNPLNSGQRSQKGGDS